MRVEEEVETLLLNYRPGHFLETPRKIGLAVSGGSDSMAMLHLHARQAESDPNRELFVATVNHGLRPEAAEECEFVAMICGRYDIPHEVLTWHDWDGSGNLQAQARDARYKLLADWANGLDLENVSLGHTQDDVAENFLIRLKRQAGVDGLAAMETTFSRHGCEFVRPLLYNSRQVLRQFLQNNDHIWRDDPSNDDQKFDRVKARNLLSAMREFGVDSYALAMSSQHLKEAKDALNDIAHEFCETRLEFVAGDIQIPCDPFYELPDDLQRRIMRQAVSWMGNKPFPPRALSLDLWDVKIDEGKPFMVHGCALTHTATELRIAREFNSVKDLTSVTNAIWDNRWQLDGPHASDLEIRALGPAGLPQCPDWRDVGLPRTSLLTSPAVWRGEELIAAPLAKLNPKWQAKLVRDRKHFFSSLFAH